MADEPEWVGMLDADRQALLREPDDNYEGAKWFGTSPQQELLMQVIRMLRRCDAGLQK